MEAKKYVETSQEQAVASWINYLNQVRLDNLTEMLKKEDLNLENAIKCIDDALQKIDKGIINNGKGLGGRTGAHGFIAEVAECGIGNAREQIEGKKPIYEWINDNGVVDIKRGADEIQMKFANSGGHFSLEAIRAHAHKYPEFVAEGNKYMIPQEHNEKIIEYLNISEEEANKMSTSTSEFSLKKWRYVNDYFENEDNGVSLDQIKPSQLRYDQVQKGTYKQTFDEEKNSLKERNEERREAAYEENKPGLAEGAKATAVSAVATGAMSLASAIIEKKKSGKLIKEFNTEDWIEIGKKTGIGTAKGAIRGSGIYVLTNYTATPTAVASALITASFGVAEQANLLRNGKLSEKEFIANSEMLCLDATISAVSSLIGQVIIPMPVVGAVIGNNIGRMMYDVACSLSDEEKKIITEYVNAIDELTSKLDAQYQEFVEEMNREMEVYTEILERAFSIDIAVAYEGSVELAKACGVPTEEILDTQEKVQAYFLE